MASLEHELDIPDPSDIGQVLDPTANNGEKRVQIEQKIVKLIGYKENPESYIKISDVFVLSSVYEGLPNVLIETLYLKKYVISSDCHTGPKEILNNGQYGDLFNVGDYYDLYNKIFYLISNKNISNKFIQNGYNDYIDKFSFNIMAKKYYNLFYN